MDTLEFLKERRRMCKSFGQSCDGCPLHDHPCTSISSMNDGDCERILAEVEQWSKEHQRKTRQSVFLEQWPNAKIIEGTLTICPYNLGLIDKCRSGLGNLCYECREKFWSQEVE